MQGSKIVSTALQGMGWCPSLDLQHPKGCLRRGPHLEVLEGELTIRSSGEGGIAVSQCVNVAGRKTCFASLACIVKCKISTTAAVFPEAGIVGLTALDCVCRVPALKECRCAAVRILDQE